LAREVGVHPVALARAFRARFGSTPGAYLRQLRLAWSVSELTDGTRSIAEIAVEAGFADQSHFTRVFRRACGETPGAFRRYIGASRRGRRPAGRGARDGDQ
jgi:AraC-like DNA-binding protein